VVQFAEDSSTPGNIDSLR